MKINCADYFLVHIFEKDKIIEILKIKKRDYLVKYEDGTIEVLTENFLLYKKWDYFYSKKQLLN